MTTRVTTAGETRQTTLAEDRVTTEAGVASVNASWGPWSATVTGVVEATAVVNGSISASWGPWSATVSGVVESAGATVNGSVSATWGPWSATVTDAFLNVAVTQEIRPRFKSGLSGYRSPKSIMVEIVDRRADSRARVLGGLPFSAIAVQRVRSDFASITATVPVEEASRLSVLQIEPQKHNLRLVRDGAIVAVGPIRNVSIQGGQLVVEAFDWSTWTLTKLAQSDIRLTPITDVDPDGYPNYTLEWTQGAEEFDYGTTGTKRYYHDIVNHLMEEARGLDVDLQPPPAFSLPTDPADRREFDQQREIVISDASLLSVREHFDSLVPDAVWSVVGEQMLMDGDLRFYAAPDDFDQPAWTVTDHDFVDGLSHAVAGPVINEKLRQINSGETGSYVEITTWQSLGQVDPSIIGNGGAETGVHQATFVTGERSLAEADTRGRRTLQSAVVAEGSRVGVADAIPGARLSYKRIDRPELGVVGMYDRDVSEMEIVTATITVERSDAGFVETVSLEMEEI